MKFKYKSSAKQVTLRTLLRFTAKNKQKKKKNEKVNTNSRWYG